MLSVKAGSYFVTLLKLIKGVLIGGSNTKSFLLSVHSVLAALRKIRQNQGLPGLVRFLKVNSVVLQQAAAGFRLRDISPIGCRVSRNGGGLPRIIPRDHRLIILNKGPGYLYFIQFYLTLFSFYRVLIIPGKLNLSSITDKGEEGVDN